MSCCISFLPVRGLAFVWILQFGIVLAYVLQVTRNQHRLLYYLLFLRMFPVSPNWLINLSCPLLDVPIQTFFITIVLGIVNQLQVSYKNVCTYFYYLCFILAVPQLKYLGSGFLQQTPELISMAVHVGCLVETVTVVQVFLRVLGFVVRIIIPHTFQSPELMCAKT